MDNLEAYIATVDELVEDEDKLVTYKLLCQHLAISCNKAKLLLDLYAKNAEPGKISVTYAVTGRCCSRIRIGVFPEDKIEEAKSGLDSVMSCHPYSVQKVKLKDTLPLYAADYDMTKKILYRCANFSSIKYTGSKQLSEEEISRLKSRTYNTVNGCSDEDKKHSTTKSKTEQKNARTNSNKSTPMHQFLSKGSKNNSPKETSKSNSDKTITCAIKEDSVKTTDKDSNEESKGSAVKETQNTVKSTKTPVGMQAFMTKGKSDLFKSRQSVTKPKPQTLASSHEDKLSSPKIGDLENNKPVAKHEVPETRNLKNGATQHEDDSTSHAEKPSNDATESKKNNKEAVKPKRKAIKKSRSNKPEPSKKRKRIQEFLTSSSSSESEPENDFDEMDVIPPSPPPVTKKELPPKNPRKKRVLKSRTFFAADGSMLTEKVWEEVSCSSGDDDADVTAKENHSPAVKEEKQKPPFKKAITKGKQSSLMGFFSKKT